MRKDYISIGELNTDIDRLQNLQSQQVTDFLASFDLVDLLGHFKQCLRFRHMKMRRQVQQGRLLRSRCNYVLGSDRRMFETVEI